ncbi:solute carrier family 23 member 2-like [Pomacea canaliculata]|nr:solute carrier family 23 member 2-like [Pomacea canaliculata]XP_025096153.1 solute carrier family 23 member 2-like [Pomacea canaliculata]XP_025096154.1 solute carrier family 23 member 2-like [Pomacea canaliculata]XP_025096155.1 solute carrier family 23 member 2-like [Pomacea canaliculata]
MPKEFIYHHVQRMSGSLMAAGAVHFLIAVTGLAGCLLRFIGPVTIVPAITLVGLYIFKVVVRFSETFWGVAVLTAATGIILSLYLAKRSTPIPFWSRSKGFHIIWYPLHQVFALLIAMMVGWGVSAILTTADVLSSDRNNVQFYARTDTRSHVITNSPWFSFPYPGRFGAPSFDTGIFIGFLLATLMSILDSIGDYSACARTCYVPQPPNWALNRGLAVEGFMSFISGALGIGHATSSFGGNIGAMGLTRVASRRVFQGVGIMYVFFSIFNKFGAVFVTIPYSVLGGCQIVTIGLFIGIVLSNLQYIDLRSTRNVAIIGISLLVGLMIPHWMEKTPNGIRTGSIDLDRTIGILLTNPVFVGGFLACFLDNTVPGTLEERGLSKHSSKEELSKGPADDHFEEGLEVYDIPYVQKYMEKSRITKVCRIFPGGSSTSSSTSSDTTRDEEERLGCLKDGDTAGLHSTNM